MNCLCCSGEAADTCCRPLLTGETPAVTALALMRSRYVAYCERRFDYILATWHPASRPARIDLPEGIQWLGPRIRRVDAGGADDQVGMVEFIARSKLNGRAERLHEVSRFERVDDHWYYLDGKTESPELKRRSHGN